MPVRFSQFRFPWPWLISADNRRWWPLLLGVALLFLVIPGMLGMLGCSGSSVQPREGSYSGRVLDVSGNPLGNVLVSWYADKTRWSLTAADGSFLVEGVAFGDQGFLFEAAGYRTLGRVAAIYSGATTDAGDIIIEAASFAFSEVVVSELSATHAEITWKTSDFTNGAIQYGANESLGQATTEEPGQFTTAHSIELSDLTPDTRYFFRIVAARENRPAERSILYQFSTCATLEDTKPPRNPTGIAAALTEQPNQITIFWTPNTDPDLKGYHLYRSESILSAFTKVDNSLIARGHERYVDVGVVTGKKYYYRVSAVDQAGNESGPSDTVAMVVPGFLTQDVVWTRANSPYLLNGDLEILDSGRLRIDPGVVVLCAAADAFRRNNPTRIDIIVEGTLIASAGNDVPIIFTSDNEIPAADNWSGLTFRGTQSRDNSLVNVTLGYAAVGLNIDQAQGLFNDINIRHCSVGIALRNTENGLVSSLTTYLCHTGIQLEGNKNPQVAGCTFYHCQDAVVSGNNETPTFAGNNFLEYVGNGLITSEKAGAVTIRDNLFVSTLGLGLHIGDLQPLVEYNTFDSAYGIRIDKGNPAIRKNIVVAKRSLTGQGFKGIEHRLGGTPLPVFGPNCVNGFSAGNDYINCASAPGSLASDPLFLKDFNPQQFDYRLYQPFPNAIDPWGIHRTEAP